VQGGRVRRALKLQQPSPRGGPDDAVGDEAVGGLERAHGVPQRFVESPVVAGGWTGGRES
jgi:hypothetical protein